MPSLLPLALALSSAAVTIGGCVPAGAADAGVVSDAGSLRPDAGALRDDDAGASGHDDAGSDSDDDAGASGTGDAGSQSNDDAGAPGDADAGASGHDDAGASDPDGGAASDDAGGLDDAGPVGADAGSDDVCTATATFVPPEACAFPNELVVYGQEGWNVLADELAASLSPCTEAWISIPPPTGDKTTVRPNEAARMHDRGARMHAVAEFHYGEWNTYRQENDLTWDEVGRMFRERMVAAGYCVESGDTWAVNEMPSSVRRDSTLRPGFEDLVRGLYEGRPGMPAAKGVVFVVGLGHATQNFSVYKPILREWLADADFWAAMNLHVRFWGQEVYVDPTLTCVTTATRDERVQHVNEYAMHVARLAAAAPDDAGANTAQSYFSRAYVPVLNAVFAADPSRGYGDTTITLEQMRRHIGQQVFGASSWAAQHTYPDGRIGFAFASYESPDPWLELAQHLASAVSSTYGTDTDAACANGACDCGVAGSAFNDGWSTFATW